VVGCENTLVFIRSKNYNKRFGGYREWKIAKDGAWHKDLSAFLFSFNHKVKIKLKGGSNDQYAVKDDTNRMSCFGGGHDLSILDKCKTASNYCNANYSYEDPKVPGLEAKKVCAGAYNF